MMPTFTPRTFNTTDFCTSLGYCMPGTYFVCKFAANIGNLALRKNGIKPFTFKSNS